MTEHKPGKIFFLIPKVMKDLDPIGKGQRNEFQGYNFRGIEDMYNFIHPILVKHGVFCCPMVQKSETFELESTDKNGKVKTSYRVILTVAHRFYAEDGSYVEAITVGEAIDSSDKASNKAMSAAMKYAFIELFSIPTKDIADSDKESPEAGRSRHQIKNVTKVGEFF